MGNTQSDRRPMTLTGAQLKQFQQALLSAFPSKNKLAQMLSFEMDENLDAIAGGDNLTDITFNLIQYAQSQGSIDKLLAAAQKENPGNPTLKAFSESLQASRNDSVSSSNIYGEKSNKDLNNLRSQEIDPSIINTCEENLIQEFLDLERLLKYRRWREANEYTRLLLLEISNARKEGYLSEANILSFPCSQFKKIDQLWLKYSERHFGFSVQNKIAAQCDRDVRKFADAVGWRHENAWLTSPDLLFDLFSSPVGHLPWGVMQVITLDNAALDAFVYGLRSVTKIALQKAWQKQLLADFMAIGDRLTGGEVDKEGFKRNLDYELAQDEAWWKGARLEELKINKLFLLFGQCF